jgi:PhzF family phenazine biosynthesis protein
MDVPIYQVDAFASKLFRGNPAAICPLNSWLPDATLQSIAVENNLAETAYYVPENGSYRLRWFTPGAEVDLCGHATLATAHVMMAIRKEISERSVSFHSKSGVLTVTRDGDLYSMDFPARAPEPREANAALFEALGAKPKEFLAARDYFCVFETEAEVRALKPNMEKLAAIGGFGTIATAPGSDCDFVSRFFAPAQGVNEDPVTGSSHCTLIPYWSARLNKTTLFARQISARGGELWCEHRGDRVTISGNAVKFLEGTIHVE